MRCDQNADFLVVDKNLPSFEGFFVCDLHLADLVTDLSTVSDLQFEPPEMVEQCCFDDGPDDPEEIVEYIFHD